MKKINNVYIIEDDAVSSFIIKRIVDEYMGAIECTVFENGRLAMDSISTTVKHGKDLPDFIFLDLNMPVMDGWEFLDALDQIKFQKPIPVFILTSSINPMDMERAQTYGSVKGFFSKPLSPSKLEEILR